MSANVHLKKLISVLLIGLCMGMSLFTRAVAQPNTANISEPQDISTDNTVSGSFNAYLQAIPNEVPDSAIILLKEKWNRNTKNGQEPLSSLTVGDTAQIVFSVKQNGRYRMKIFYTALAGSDQEIDLAFSVDGTIPYNEAGSVNLPRYFENETPIKANQLGNEYQPTQIEKSFLNSCYFYDSNGLYENPLEIYLEAGEHTFSINLISESFQLEKLELLPAKPILEYRDYFQKYKSNDATLYDGKEIVIQGESADYKTRKSIALKSDSAEPAVTPNSPYTTKINYIGGDAWQKAGDTVFWEIQVPKTGFYQLGMRYLQSYILGGYSYRRLQIDGEIPFKEAASISFPYSDDWVYRTIGEDNNPYYLYLEEGKHVISLAVTMGPFSSINRELQGIVEKLGVHYRQIVKITGETPDVNRDYDLFGQISGLDQSFKELSSHLNRLIGEMQKLTGSKGGSNIVVLQNMKSVLDEMRKHPFQAQDYKESYYSYYCSVGSILYSMRTLSLGLDVITLTSPNTSYSGEKLVFWQRVSFSLKRFLYSFVTDYSRVSESEQNDAVTIWLYWGRDQTQVFEKLVQESFVPQYNIPVNIKIVNSGIIHALLADQTPDLALRLERTQPVNLAIRGALEDLSGFDDFDEVCKRFNSNATVPYTFRGGCYGLPDTHDFNVLFYRTDVFDEYGLKPPVTWEDFYHCVSVLSKNNMQVGLPAPTTTTAGLFTTMLLQNGGQLYQKDERSTMLNSSVAVRSFEDTVKMFSDYGLPVTYDFYNRFRSGEMPLGITTYAFATQLSVTAPEIDGKWNIAVLPGVKTEGGFNRKTASGGSADVIIKKSKNKENAWTFLKWWTSAEVQASFSNDTESILGEVARTTSANREAISLLSWKKGFLDVIQEQWNYVEEIPEVPGGYYTYRSINMAFWNVYNNHEDAKDSIVSWGNAADREIKRKLSDYHLY